MVVYRFSLSDNDSYAFREYPKITEYQRIHQELIPDFSGELLTARRCEACGELLDKWNELPQNLVINKRKYDISVTCDGITVVSARFKSAYDNAELIGLAFQQLPNDRSFFIIRAVRAVSFDSDRRKTRFIKPCPICGRFESVVGATPVYLKAGSEIGGHEFVRTDLEFGSNDRMHPLFLCGEVAARSLKAANLKRLDLVAIEDAHP